MKFTFKIWLMIFFLAMSFLAIFAGSGLTKSGVIVTSINSENNSLFDLGLRQGDIITSVDGQKVDSLEDFSSIVSNKFTGEEVKTIINTKNNEYIILTNELPEMVVDDISNTNLKLGLDLAGGSRAIVKAKNRTLTQQEVNDLVDITSNRLNAFGLTDLKVSPVSDLAGNNFMRIEIAGVAPKDLKKLLSEQGEFIAKIGNETVFIGGKDEGIASVGRSGQEAYVEKPRQNSDGTYYSTFRFSLYLKEAAAKRHAEVTDKLEVNVTPQGNYLSKNLDLYLDGNLVNSLAISEGLKGEVTTQISISGSGSGATPEEAVENAKAEMKQLQTVLMTGSLPFKLEIVKLDTISPSLGEEFTNTILFAGLVAILVVALIIFIRYRSWKSSLALIVVSVSEVIIVLGIASLIRWNLDLPGIAGILVTIGTGIDDLIILMDETGEKFLSLKQRLKRAFTIILGAYFTTFVSLLPLLWAGAGLLKGFAITTIIGISVGVFITRPAFGDMLKNFRD
jgi:preprotein translocase subunit SecD